MEAYKEFVRKNSNLLGAVEGGLSSLTWLLPDRFAESELSIETLHSLLGLVSLWHESIVKEPRLPPGRKAPIPWPLYLGAVQQVEILGEIAADRFRGSQGKFGPIALIELIKALIRLCILHAGRGRLLLEGGSLGNRASNPAFPYYTGYKGEEQRRAVEADKAAKARRAIAATALAKFREDRMEAARGTPTPPPGTVEELPAEGPGGGKGKGPAVDPEVEARAVWWAGEEGGEGGAAKGCRAGGGVEGEADEGEAPDVPRHLALPSYMVQGQRYILAGEVLHILRPVVYAVAMRRWGRTSWKPWLLSLAVDFSSNVMNTHGELLLKFGQHSVSNRLPWAPPPGAPSGTGEFGEGWSMQERSELARRKLNWGYYLLRSPAFEAVTKPPLMLMLRGIGRVPLVGGLSEKAMEILLGVQGYYFYLAAS